MSRGEMEKEMMTSKIFMHIISCLTNNSKKTEKNENEAMTYRRRLYYESNRNCQKNR